MRDANVYEGVHVRHGYGIANDDSKTMTQQLDQVTANNSLQKKHEHHKTEYILLRWADRKFIKLAYCEKWEIYLISQEWPLLCDGRSLTDAVSRCVVRQSTEAMLDVEVIQSDRLAAPEVTSQRCHIDSRNCHSRRRRRTAPNHFRFGVTARTACRPALVDGFATQLSDSCRRADSWFEGNTAERLRRVWWRRAVDG